VMEKLFNDELEKDKGYAVDTEVARTGDRWNVVQARVILMDR
jgi:endonuclease III